MAETLFGHASSFAIEQHGDQRYGDQRYGQKPYHVHLIDVVNVLRRFVDWPELDQAYIDAAWLHDVVEDTATTIEQVRVLFGDRVAELVHAVTNETGINRKERHEKTYPKIISTPGALRLKLADRIANVEQAVSHDRFGRPPQKLFRMYDREWEGFVTTLRGKCSGEGEIESAMWQYLTELMEEGRDKEKQFRSLKTFRGEI